jgi:subtilisin family serine protease
MVNVIKRIRNFSAHNFAYSVIAVFVLSVLFVLLFDKDQSTVSGEEANSLISESNPTPSTGKDSDSNQLQAEILNKAELEQAAKPLVSPPPPVPQQPNWKFINLADGYARYQSTDGRVREAHAARFIVDLGAEVAEEPASALLCHLPGHGEVDFPLRIYNSGASAKGIVEVGSEWYPLLAASLEVQAYTLRPDWVIRLNIKKSISAGALPANEEGGVAPESRWHYDLSGLDDYIVRPESLESPIVVAVIDTGIDRTHPQLASQIYVNSNEIPDNGLDDDENGYIDDVHGWNFYDDTNDPIDSNFHGTHVAGIIAARALTDDEAANFPYTPAPASPAAAYVKILPLKVFGPDEVGYMSDFERAIYYAHAMEVDLVNNSWGNDYNEWDIQNAISYSGRDGGQVHVCAAGNDGLDLDYSEGGWGPRNDTFPAEYDYDWVYGVAAHEPDRSFSDFSNFGSNIDTTAPGGFLLSTMPLTLNAEAIEMGGEPGSQYWSGTSMATPVVTAGLSLLMANNEFLRRRPELLREFYLTEYHEAEGFPVEMGRALSYPIKDPQALFVINPNPRRVTDAHWYSRIMRIERGLPYNGYNGRVEPNTYFFVELFRTGPVGSALPFDVTLSEPSARPLFAQFPESSHFLAGQSRRALGFVAICFAEDEPVAPEVFFSIGAESQHCAVYGAFDAVFPAKDDRYATDVYHFDPRFESDDSDGDGIIAIAEAAFGSDLNHADISAMDMIDFGIELAPRYAWGAPMWDDTAYVEVTVKNSNVGLFEDWLMAGSYFLEMSEDLVSWTRVPLSYYTYPSDDPRKDTGQYSYRYQANIWSPQDPPFPIVPQRFFRLRYLTEEEALEIP